MSNKIKQKLEDYAAKPVLILSGSLLVLSVALNNIGFKGVIDAYALSIVNSIENEKACKADIMPSFKLKAIEKRLLKLESNSHKPK